MKLEGQLEEIIYQNENNSYTIAELSTDEEIFTVVGYLPFINEGDFLSLEGKFVTHQDYGRQFKIDTFEKKLPEGKAAVEKYLASGIIKGIGPSTAKKIVDKFGDETIAIFKFEPKRLAEVRGISENGAKEMAEEFNRKWELWQIVGFLEKFGINASNSKKVYEVLGEDAIEEIKKNPYVLIDITYGVDFFKIDKMALDLGINVNSYQRIAAGIRYGLILASYNGNTCVEKESLYSFVKDKLSTDEKYIDEVMINLKSTGKIVEEEIDGKEWIFLEEFYRVEKNIATRLYMMMRSQNTKYIKSFETILEKEESLLDIQLSEKQKEALKEVNNSNVSIITGGPGTGKTTIIKALIDIYHVNKQKVVLCAPTGRAAKRMSESTGEEAKTIHRLLDIGKIEDNKLENIEADFAPIDADVIVIDEMSMVDVFLMNYVTKAIYMGTKLVLVGDSNQLPSVGPGSVLKDLIESEKIPTTNLDKIFRQAAQSKIILNAHQVNKGEYFISKENFENTKEDFFFIKENSQEKIINQLVSLTTGRLQKFGNYDFFQNMQILTPTKKGPLGTRELNKTLQNYINPENKSKKEKKFGEITFREGDRVMQIKNNYDIFWDREILGVYENSTGVFNGEIGRIEKIDLSEKQLKVVFDDEKNVWYQFQELDQLELAYAITIHKSQGSEFDVVIIAVPQTAPMLLTRNLLYTAITRAKKLLIILGGKNTIDFMIQNVDSKKRNTGLKIKVEHLLNGDN